MLKNIAGQWVHDLELLMQQVRDFYVNLYTTEMCLSSDIAAWHFPRLTHCVGLITLFRWRRLRLLCFI